MSTAFGNWFQCSVLNFDCSLSAGEILTSYGFALLVTGWLLFRSNLALRNTLLITGLFYLVAVPAMMLVWELTAGMAAASEITGYTSAGDWFTRIFFVPFNPIYLAFAYPLLFLVVLGYRAGRENLFQDPAGNQRLLRNLDLGLDAVAP